MGGMRKKMFELGMGVKGGWFAQAMSIAGDAAAERLPRIGIKGD
jgi:hypothetical protein